MVPSHLGQLHLPQACPNLTEHLFPSPNSVGAFITRAAHIKTLMHNGSIQATPAVSEIGQVNLIPAGTKAGNSLDTLYHILWFSEASKSYDPG